MIAIAPSKVLDLLLITMRPLSQLFELKAHRGLSEHGGGVRRNLQIDSENPHLLNAPDVAFVKMRDCLSL